MMLKKLKFETSLTGVRFEAQNREGNFPRSRVGDGRSVHLVDDYRYRPGRTLCGRHLTGTESSDQDGSAAVCLVCLKRADVYPTQAEFNAHWRCTDCGINTWEIGEVQFQVKPSVWGIAYPGYNQHHAELGSSRPCIGCLEGRLGRRLVADDFTTGHTTSRLHSPRLNSRIIRTVW